MAVYLNFKSQSPKNPMFLVMLKLVQKLLIRFYLFLSVYNRFFVISPWKKAWFFIWTHLDFIYPEMLVPSSINIDQGFWREIFVEILWMNDIVHFCSSCYCLPLEKVWPFIWTILNVIYSKNVICQVRLIFKIEF